MRGSESRYEAFLGKLHRDHLTRDLIEVAAIHARTLAVGDRSYVNLASNDYLGLRFHHALIERACAWAKDFGTGSGASRLVTGNLELFAHVERKVAALKQKPAALLMASGFQANAGVLKALFDKAAIGSDPQVFADRLNHASMHFGCQAAGVSQIRYRHLDVGHLAVLLEQHASPDRPKYILTESVFSMDGDVAPIPEIAALARDYDAMLVVDDAHATGILGEDGRGLSAGADLVIGTFSKALGSFGAYVACSETMRDYLVNRCGALIYSTALPPQVLGAVDAALDILPSLGKERAHAAELSHRFRNEAQRLGFDTAGSSTQIVPLVAGSAETALQLSEALRRAGYWATAIRPPTVPQGTARVRCVFTAAHELGDVDGLMAVLAAASDQLAPAASS